MATVPLFLGTFQAITVSEQTRRKETQVARFDDWCRSANSAVGNHRLRFLTGERSKLATGIEATAAVVPGHYASKERISRVLDRLGKSAAAALIRETLPTTKAMKSGDLGEIYATEWIEAHSGGYSAPITRLRWKDHRDMPMRGDDVIAMLLDPRSRRLHFLKAEAKSRATLTARTLSDARAGLDKDGGLPSAHALQFISARVFELGDLSLTDAIDDALLKHDIQIQDVRHLMFTFSGNAPDTLLTESLRAYEGTVTQWGVGLRVEGHAEFVGAIYERVITDADDA